MYFKVTCALLLVVCCLLPTAAPAEVITGVAGGGQPHTNIQPSLALNHIIALQGIFPSRDKDCKGEPYLGEVNIFAGNFAPRGWAFCEGQLLPINQNQALFALLGTTYGGDGRTTFALPDLRGRAAVHPGTGPGLSSWQLGQRTGADQFALTEAQMPAHEHTLPQPGSATELTGGGQSHANIQPSLGLNYTIAMEGIYPSRPKDDTEFIAELGMFAGNFAPRGEAFPNGQLLPISQNTALFSLLGTTYGGDGRTTFGLPDLRGRTAIHAGQGPGLTLRLLGQRAGVEDVTLTEAQLPAHRHTLPPSSDLTDATGGSQPHTNMQPSLALNYMIALQGVYPSRNKDDKGVEPFIGEISLFAGNFAPRGWALCDGQLLPIPQNTALFSLLGTTYGGDGRTTFGLPDLRGRVPVHPGQGVGLAETWFLGEEGGVESLSLTVAQMPAHTHVVPEPSSLALLASGLLALACIIRRRRG